MQRSTSVQDAAGVQQPQVGFPPIFVHQFMVTGTRCYTVVHPPGLNKVSVYIYIYIYIHHNKS